MMIYLDFFSGAHGHFLEYVINTWIFKGPRMPNIFTKLGTCHLPGRNLNYIAQRAVAAEHYTEYNISQNIPIKLVRITINHDWTNWIYQINVMSRAGDMPLEKKLTSTPESVRNSPNKFRNEWYAKFNLSGFGYQQPGHWRWPDVSSFEFCMESLFDLVEFYNELYRLSEFLEEKFVPDQELTDLLEEFLIKNQGWQCYKKSKHIVHHALVGNNIEFHSDEMSQALINTLLSRTIGVCDGKLFDHDDYPTNTAQLRECIDLHLKTFSHRF